MRTISTTGDSIMWIENLVVVAGVIAGLMMAGTACLAYLKHQMFGFPGVTLVVFGTILIGMTVWARVSVVVGKDGIQATFSQMQETLKSIESENKKIGGAVESLTNDFEEETERLGQAMVELAFGVDQVRLLPKATQGPGIFDWDSPWNYMPLEESTQERVRRLLEGDVLQSDVE